MTNAEALNRNSMILVNEGRSDDLIIECITGREAFDLFARADFLAEWKRLYDCSHWGSVYQSDKFVITWFDTYRADYEPLIVVGKNDDGRICGIFFLAVDKATGQLIVAGGKHAEYQAWLSDSSIGDLFIVQALTLLKKRYPGRRLTLLFVLPQTPVSWARHGGALAGYCHVKTLPRGLLSIGDGSAFRDAIRKKLQNKVNRLKRLGELTFVRVSGQDEFESLFDQFTVFQNLRLRAVYNLPEIDHDPLRKTLYIRLMNIPGFLYTTALRVDDKLISAQIHTYNRDQLLLGLITHSPFYAKYSPGVIHTQMLGVELALQKIETFDLTPGGEYKDRYATHHDDVYVINIFFSKKDALIHNLRTELLNTVKLVMDRAGISYERGKQRYLELLDKKNKWRSIGLYGWAKSLLSLPRRIFWNSEEIYLYEPGPSNYPNEEAGHSIKRNSIDDLQAYRPFEAEQLPMNMYLRRAVRLIEEGGQFYTCVEGGELQFCAWVVRQKEKAKAGWIEETVFDGRQAVLVTDLYCRPGAEEIFDDFLDVLTGEISSGIDQNRLILALPADRQMWRSMAESKGFIRSARIVRNTSMGRRKVTSDLPAGTGK